MAVRRGQVQRNVNKLKKELIRDTRRFLSQTFAPEIERETKNVFRGWRDDTGSARGATTAYVVDQDDPRKNWNDPDWVRARTQPGVSRYSYNTPANYRPYEKEAPTVGDVAVILTTFVRYGMALEQPGNVLTHMPDTFFRAMTAHQWRFKYAIEAIVSGILARYRTIG